MIFRWKGVSMLDMAIREIVKYPHPALLKTAEPVEEITDEVRSLVADMAETMYAAPGVGLAAPQIGVSKQVAVLDTEWKEESRNLIVLINPEIIDAEGDINYEEGCLSVPELMSDIPRKERVTVKGLNLEGEEIVIKGEGLLAVALQHEIDHLNGKIILDRISSLKRTLYKKKLKKIMNAES